MKRDLDALDWQERHRPTEAVEVRVTGERKRVATRRRKQDARIFDGLSSYHEQAMMDILAAFLYVIGGAGYRSFRYERIIPGARPLHGNEEKLREYYKEWCDRAKHGAFKLKPALEIIIEAKSYTITASKYNKRRTWVRDNFHDGLMAYCDIRGWDKRLKR